MKVLVATLLLAVVAQAQQLPMIGFQDPTGQRALEARYDGFLKAANLRENMRQLSLHPHHVGSPWGKQNADFLAAHFRAAGFDTHIEEFQALFPTPKTRLLEMISPEKYTARLQEPALAEDATSGQTAEQLPTYNAYSCDGDVTGQLVYVNYGVPADYEELALRGIDVKGKIAIARYGGSWRGIKPKVAAEHGAVGCLIYSDPRDDGYFQGDVYPNGPMRMDQGVQRGSVADMPIYAGDPLTPGVGATADAKRLEVKDAATITKIPVLPISYGDALPLLKALGGPMAPESWRGALPIPYRLGAGPATVHLKLEFNWDLAPVRDVIAMMKGSELPDQWVIRGNHHDGWVNGAQDPISGQVAMMEEARAIGELAKTGWRPRRTIVYCAWDGEEPGLIGSTEWVETHEAELRDKAVVYINTDSNSRGFLYAAGSSGLQRLVNESAADVTDPERNIPVTDRRRAASLAGAPVNARDRLRRAPAIELEALGSGSDFTPFLQHLGVASLNIGFGGESDDGSYHSIFDSFDLYTRFNDTNFDYGITLAKVAGRLVLRLADADALPFDFTVLADAIGTYTNEVKTLADDLRASTDERNRMITDGSLLAAADPREPFVVPEVKPAVPHLNFAPLENAVERLKASARALSDRSQKGLSATDKALLDRAYANVERSMMDAGGLPGRPWFRHFVYAPGQYTGYGVKTLHGVRDAIAQRNWADAEQQIVVLAGVLNACASQIDSAAALIGSK
ncbi:MAG TPA: transferrin receptor-like dimerization domain-containing protein [Blastocatellia bacterium]|nr:transferrin receptor-like dimerization domain-containing protein [Blastocatellia bacterium]